MSSNLNIQELLSALDNDDHSNLLNTSYVETGIVPMPKGNLLFGLRSFF